MFIIILIGSKIVFVSWIDNGNEIEINLIEKRKIIHLTQSRYKLC